MKIHKHYVATYVNIVTGGNVVYTQSDTVRSKITLSYE